MKSPYTYYAVDIQFESDILLPDLIKIKASEIDVRIILGTLPDIEFEPTIKTSRYKYNQNNFYLKIDNIAQYLICNGNTIYIEPIANASHDDIRIFLYSTVFGALFHQRKMLAIHASCICNSKYSFAFAGASGIGKSTLAYSFLKDFEYDIISDDVTVIDIKDVNIVTSAPALPRIKLWQDMVTKFKISKEVNIIRDEIPKFNIPIKERFCTEKRILKAIFFLSTSHQNEVMVEKITGSKKLTLFNDNIFKIRFAKDLKMQSIIFDKAVKILPHVDFYSITRPRNGQHFNEIKLLIEEIISKFS